MRRRKRKMNNQKYGQEFSSKKRLLEWIEKNADKITWDYGVWVEWYEEDDEENV
jgi:hypothetical protein